MNQFLENPSIEAELDLLENLELMDPNQRVIVNVTIESLVTQEFEYDFSEIDIRNLDEDLTVESIDSSIRVVVKGTESLISTITKDTLKPYIYLSSFVAGELDVTLQVEEIEGLIIESTEPEELTINLVNR